MEVTEQTLNPMNFWIEVTNRQIDIAVAMFVHFYFLPLAMLGEMN